MKNDYYTYAWLRKDGTPYYIGKGTKDRAYREWNRNRNRKPPKDVSRILILKRNLTEEEAFRHECYMIFVFGRKDNGTGILINLTDGGDGVRGIVIGEERRKKMSEDRKKKLESPEVRKRMSEVSTGERNPASVKWRITFEDGRIIERWGLSKWAREEGYFAEAIRRVAYKKQKKHKDIVAVEKLGR